MNIDIGQVLRSSGPVVKAVLLRHIRVDGKDAKPHLAAPTAPGEKTDATKATDGDAHHHRTRPVLIELIDEIEIDTTPSKRQVEHVMGGPWTFLGQYPDVGIVIIVRHQLPELDDADDLGDMSIRELQSLCRHFGVSLPDSNESSSVPKSELLKGLRRALEEQQPPVNPHCLQPPFDDITVRGDILLLRVAADDDDDDEDNQEDPAAVAEAAATSCNGEVDKMAALSNDEFFLDYTKVEYVEFASRTDIVAPPTAQHEEPSDEYEEADDDDDDNDDDDDEYNDEDADEDYDANDDEMDEEEKLAMLNLILGGVLRRFREEHGRGPDSDEVLHLRAQVARELGIAGLPTAAELPPSPAPKKRQCEEAGHHGADDEGATQSSSAKRVKFNASFKADDNANGKQSSGKPTVNGDP